MFLREADNNPGSGSVQDPAQHAEGATALQILIHAYHALLLAARRLLVRRNRAGFLLHTPEESPSQ